MRTPLYLIALALSDIAETDLSAYPVVLVVLFVLFFGMDVLEIAFKGGKYEEK